ncbi:MAG: DUF2490 domain-containing protein [Acidobacteria bacterium]|nr:DUF2490 domain-containing protein [Acidobacteriota bacterium]
MSALPFTALFVLLLALPAKAQTETEQFWPEIATYVKINQEMRLYFQVVGTRENFESTGVNFGASFDYYLKPLVNPKTFVVFQMDEARARRLLFRAGYHYITSTSSPTEQRIVLEATPRFPLKSGVRVVDRNRADLRFIQDEFSWRYRNRLTIEREFTINSYSLLPFVRAEVYYDSNYEKWSTTAISGGCVFPIQKNAELELFYEHKNNTGTSPNQQVNAIGLTLNLYFRR